MRFNSWFGVAVVLLGFGTLLPAADHPRDPWVFRSVLDTRARMLTAAFSDKLYVAYDTQECTLRKAWAGDVKFTGGVYDARHGPQPQSEGPAYFRLKKEAQSWTLVAGNSDAPTKPHYLGYHVKDDKFSLAYSFQSAGNTVTVIESPTYDIQGDQVTLIRTFMINGLPEKGVLALSIAGEAGDPKATYQAQMPDPSNFSQDESAARIRFDRNGTFVLRTTWKVQ